MAFENTKKKMSFGRVNGVYNAAGTPLQIDFSKLKEFADDNFKFDYSGRKFSR